MKGNDIKIFYTHPLYNEVRNEENKRLGILSLEEQEELIGDEADKL